MDMNENKRRRSMLLYILIAVVVYLAVSQTMYPALTNSQTKEVSYSDFLTMVDKNEVTQVQKTQGDAQLYFTTGSGDSQQKYSTVIFGSGDGLNEKLEDHGVQMVGKIADTSGDMWFYLLLSYGLPIDLRTACSGLRTRSESMRRRMRSKGAPCERYRRDRPWRRSAP